MPFNNLESPPLLVMEEIDKSFPGVHALKSVSLELHEAEVLALVGENGAGKSTLIKVLGGAHSPDHGKLFLSGILAHISNPSVAQRAGIAIIYQEFNLVPELTARENIFLGREKTTAGFIRSDYERRETARLFEEIGLQISQDTRCSRLTVAEQQKLEIAKALSLQARVIVMDEPTAALTSQEVHNLFAIIRRLQTRNVGFIYISHRLDEVFDISDRVMVLRDGERVACHPTANVSRKQLIELMVGRSIDAEFPTRSGRAGSIRLQVDNLCRGTSVRNVSFTVRAGEVLGLAGLAGSGRTETARLIFGADRPDSGQILVNGREVRIRNPRRAIRNGICLLTEDRKGQGLVLQHSIRENFGLPNLDHFSFGPVLRQNLEHQTFATFADRLSIKVSGQDQEAGQLSGGNQQKLVLAKWLERNADIIIFDEPTRGIDVGAKYEIYLLINQLVASGKAVIMISSELPEVLGMSDRVVVMRNGSVRGEFSNVNQTTQEDILSLAIQ